MSRTPNPLFKAVDDGYRIRLGSYATILTTTFLFFGQPVYAQSTQQLPSIDVYGNVITSEPVSDVASNPNAKGNDVTISKEDIQRSGAVNSQGLFAGETTVRAGGTSPANTKVYVNGIEETMLNVQIDGARQPQRSGFHHNNNSVVDPEMLKGVAVDGGVAAADAGPHALGGAIRYTTSDVDDLLSSGKNIGAFAKLVYDTNSKTFMKSGAVYGKGGGFEVLSYGKWADGDDYKDGAGNTVEGTDIGLTNYLGKLAYQSLDGHRFTLSAEHIQDEGIRPFRANLAYVPDFQLPFSENESARDTYTFNYSTKKPTDFFDPKLTFYYNKNTLIRPHMENPPTFTTPFVPPPFNGLQCLPGVTTFVCVAFGKTEIESTGSKAQNTFSMGPGKLTAGLDYYQEKTSVDHGGGTAVLSEEASDFGIYAQYRFEPFKGLHMSAGSRFDWHSLDAADRSTHETSGASPNISAEVDLFSGLTAKVFFGRTFGGIPIYETILIKDTSPIYSTDLKAQTSQQMKLGLAYENSGFSVEGTYFKTSIFDPVSPNLDPVVNEGDLVTKGFNLSASYKVRGNRLTAKFQHTDTEFAGTALSTTQWYYGTPQGDMLTLSGHYEFQGTGFAVGFLSLFAFEYDRLENVLSRGAAIGVLDAYDVHNIYAQWSPQFAENLTFRVDVLNLFDEDYVERSTAVNPSFESLRSPGRSVMFTGKVKY